METVNTVQENADNKENTDLYTRRSFFGALLGIGTIGMGAYLVVPVMRYILYPLYAKSDQSKWSLVGPMEDFANLDQPIQKKINFTRLDGWREVVTAQSVYVTRGADGQLEVLSAICPHLGCSVGWHKAQDVFLCPCHGGKYKPDGAHISGPPPRGMDPLPHKIEDGKLMVHFEYFREDVPNREVLSA